MGLSSDRLYRYSKRGRVFLQFTKVGTIIAILATDSHQRTENRGYPCWVIHGTVIIHGCFGMVNKIGLTSGVHSPRFHYTP